LSVLAEIRPPFLKVDLQKILSGEKLHPHKAENLTTTANYIYISNTERSCTGNVTKKQGKKSKLIKANNIETQKYLKLLPGHKLKC
jgi:hypothetical protein